MSLRPWALGEGFSYHKGPELQGRALVITACGKSSQILLLIAAVFISAASFSKGNITNLINDINLIEQV